MYDMILGPASEAVWLKGGSGVIFHREYSRVCLPVTANFVGPLSVFNYKREDTNIASLVACAAGVATRATEWDCSNREENKSNETFWATHLRIQVQRITMDTALATDRTLVPADYRQLVARAYFRFFHMKEEQAEAEGVVEDFPEAMGSEYESVGTNFFTVTNGPSHFGAAKPLPKPLLYKARATFISGRFDFGTTRGGVTMSQAPQGIMVYVDGYRFPKGTEIAQAQEAANQ